LFNTDALTGTFTYPIDIPLTDKNRKQLGFPESLLNRIAASPSINIDYYYGGILFKEGIFKILKITDKISCTFISGIGNINDLIKDRKISSVNYGGDVFFPTEGSLGLEFVGYNAPGFGGRVGNPMHLTLNITYAGVTTEFGKALSSILGGAGDINALISAFNADSSGMAANHIISVTSDINETVLPYFYRIIFELASGATASVNMDYLGVINNYKSSFWKTVPSSAVQPKAKFMNDAAALSYPHLNYTFFPIKNDGFYSGNNNDYSGYINFYNNSSHSFSYNTTIDGSRTKYSIIPFPYFLYIFKTIFSEISYFAKGNFIEDEEIKKIVIYNTMALDSILFDSVTPDTVIINKWADSFNLKNHVPDMLITDFIKFVKSFFCIGYFVDDSKRTVEIILLKDVINSVDYDDFTSFTSILKEIDLNDGLGYILKLPDTNDQYIKDNVIDLSGYTVKDPVATVTDLYALSDQQEKDVRYVISLDEYWKLIFITNGTTITNLWQKFSENYYNYKVGNGGNEIPLNANTLLTIIDPASPFQLLPITNEEGSSKEFDIGNNNNDKLRFLIYRGMQSGASGNLYPLGTNGYKSYSGVNIGSLSLKLDDPDYGMNKMFFNSWLKFLASTKSVIANTELDIPKLMDVNLLKRKKRIDNVEYLINKINVNMTMTGIKPSTVQYYKV
jgi:hypothetical protein